MVKTKDSLWDWGIRSIRDFAFHKAFASPQSHTALVGLLNFVLEPRHLKPVIIIAWVDDLVWTANFAIEEAEQRSEQGGEIRGEWKNKVQILQEILGNAVSTDLELAHRSLGER